VDEGADAGAYSVVKSIAARTLTLTATLMLAGPVYAYEHEDSPVNFVEYAEGMLEQHKDKKRPYFLLFSAQWCFWCKVFAEKTLSKKEVSTYLNENYVSVFIDADIHNALYVRYGATGLPFTVFLNPDGSLHFKYGGTLYGEDFLDVIRRIKSDVGQKVSVKGEDAALAEYSPPAKLADRDLEAMRNEFKRSVQSGFDSDAHGFGNKEKAVLPRTFLYMLNSTRGIEREAAVRSVQQALSTAIDRIYDPVEGGFFRYAETRDWQVPHYEKMADLNAGVALLLYRLDKESPSKKLREAADKTLAYLTSTLYDSKTGSFLSFQEADEHYYTLDADGRKHAKKPLVIRKVFTDRLAGTLNYLIDVLDYASAPSLEGKIKSSLEFLAGMVAEGNGMRRYYSLAEKRWLGKSTLQDYALVGHVFLKAASRFNKPRYRELAHRSVQAAINSFFDKDKQVFIDVSFGLADDVEYLMEMNGLLAQTMMQLDEKKPGQYAALVTGLMTYFSHMDEVLEDRLWETDSWEFTERYVPYLEAADGFLMRRTVAKPN
jgi:uncharacterized protein YyaL (SSP411 family)